MLPLPQQLGSTYLPSTSALGQPPHPTTSPAMLLREAYTRALEPPSNAVPGTVTQPVVATSSQVFQLPNVSVPGASAGAGASIPAGSAVPASKSSVSSFSGWGTRRGLGRSSVIPRKAGSAVLIDTAKPHPPRTPSTPILGHSLTDNKSAANHFRSLLYDGTEEQGIRLPQRTSPDTANTQASGPATSQGTNESSLCPDAETSERADVKCTDPSGVSSTLLAEAYRQEYGAPYGRSGSMFEGPSTSITTQAHPQSLDNLHVPTSRTRATTAYPSRPTAIAPDQSSYRLSTPSSTPSTVASAHCSIPATRPHLIHQGARYLPSNTDSLASALASGLFKLKRPRSPPVPPQPLLLPGLGEGLSRNEYGRSLTGGQETGVGVIGSVQIPNPREYHEGSALSGFQTLRSRSRSQDRAGVVERLSAPFFTNTPTPQGASALRETALVNGGACDIPMLTASVLSQAPEPGMEEPEQGKIRAGPHLVDLDPELPPLAVEHPARVWNSMLHSLSAGVQPVVKWDYERVYPGESDEAHTIAHLTLILPPTHPAIAQHPLFRALPKNKYTKEYIASVEALGGVREWTGEPKKLKGDAQNSTLIRCIAEDALEWVHAPLLSTLPQDLDEDDDKDDGLSLLALRTDINSQLPASRPDRSGLETPISNSDRGGHESPGEALTGRQPGDMSNHEQYQARRPDLTFQLEEEEERRKLRAKSTSVSVPAWAERLLHPQEGNHGRYAPAPAHAMLGVEQGGNGEETKVETSNEDEIQLDDGAEEMKPRRYGVVSQVASNGGIHDRDDQPVAAQPSGLQRLTDILRTTLGPGDLQLARLVDLQSTCDASTKRFGATLTVGHSELVQTYQEDCVHPSEDDAKEAG